MEDTTFYAQQREDEFLWRNLFQNKTDGVFVDVGAHDGIEFSNTYFFELQGWTGICVEPHPESFMKLKENRKCKCVWTQVGYANKAEEEFWITDYGLLSSGDAGYKDRTIGWHGEKAFQGWRRTTTPITTLDKILTNNFELDQQITLLSIDVESTELAVLAGFDLDKWKPRVVVIEISDTSNERIYKVDPYFHNRRYYSVGNFSSNYIYCRDYSDKLALLP